MKDRLEEFILQNREAFDGKVPGLAVWTGVEKAVHKKKYRRLAAFRRLQQAAAVLLILGTGALLGVSLTRKSSVLSKESTLELSHISSDYGLMEDRLQQQIQEKEALVLQLVKDPALENDLKNQENNLRELKTLLNEVPESRREEVVDAILQHYQTRVALLDQILEYANRTYSPPVKTVNYYE